MQDERIVDWSSEAKEIAQLIRDKYGDPDEVTDSMLIWHNNGPWKRTIVHRDPVPHQFPKPHLDGVQQFVDYDVPIDKYDDLAAFDGSVVAERTNGELSARCHDEEANFLALNLAHDIITGRKTVKEAREAYKQAMLDYRANKAVAYMEGLQFSPQFHTRDPDVRTLREEELDNPSKKTAKS
jgi:hypothetical protein